MEFQCSIVSMGFPQAIFPITQKGKLYLHSWISLLNLILEDNENSICQTRKYKGRKEAA